MAANFENTYVLNVNLQQLMACVRDPMFISHLNLEFISENPTPAGIWYHFYHGMSFASWCEKIIITFTPIHNGATQIHIRSECGMPTQIIDWGKNKQLVGQIYDYLAVNAMRYPAVQLQPAASAFCTACGSPLTPGARFCRTCGQRLS